MKERFEDVCDDHIAELKQLQETRVTLSEEYLVSAYLAGQRLNTQTHVRMFQPQTIRHYLILGRLYEMPHPKKLMTQN